MALTELKVRARLRLNALKKAAAPDAASGAAPAPKLRDCLDQVAREAGFAHWEHARRVLSGEAVAGDDMGSFWYAPRCGTLLNQWFASPQDARAARQATSDAFLLPYRRQFVVVQRYFIAELGLEPDDPLWAQADRDLVASYGTTAWQALAARRMRAPRETFAPIAGTARRA